MMYKLPGTEVINLKPSKLIRDGLLLIPRLYDPTVANDDNPLRLASVALFSISNLPPIEATWFSPSRLSNFGLEEITKLDPTFVREASPLMSDKSALLLIVKPIFDIPQPRRLQVAVTRCRLESPFKLVRLSFPVMINSPTRVRT